MKIKPESEISTQAAAINDFADLTIYYNIFL